MPVGYRSVTELDPLLIMIDRLQLRLIGASFGRADLGASVLPSCEALNRGSCCRFVATASSCGLSSGILG